MAKGEKEPLPVYELRPPEWLPTAHTSGDIGYIGFYPPRPNDVEETLTEANVKHGLVLKPEVLAEHYSQQHEIRKRLMQDDALSVLEDVMNQIFARKAESVPPIPSSSFRLPSRVTLNDGKRLAWFADLANPDIPLSKLGKNVPHGAKGHDLLDLLHTNNVAIPRAVWFLRVFGANESAGLRNRPSYNPTQYSVEWANVMTSYMKKQLADIALPSAPRLVASIKQTFKGVLSDVDMRQKWISRFTYCLSLLRTFYAEGLVDNRTFLAWLVQQMSTCNLAQAGFVVRLADEYLDGMLVSRALTRPFIEASLVKLEEMKEPPANEFLPDTTNILKSLISRAFLALPDACICPRMHIQYGARLQEVLMENFGADGAESSQVSIQALRQTVLDTLSDIQRRNEAMLFEHLPPRVLGSLSSALSDVKLLNSISGKTDMSSVSLFDDNSEISPSFSRKLDFLMTWSVTPLQYGDHRPYAAACLLQIWRNKAEERALRRDAPSPDGQIQDLLFDWLDGSDVAGESGNLPAVALLFGQLVKRELFSYEQYMQRLIARGETGLSFGEEEGSRHRHFLRWIPLNSSDASVISQRKVILYGFRVRETPEDANEREIRKEFRILVPEVFGGEPQTDEPLTTTFWKSCGALLSAPRYEQLKIMKQWFLPIYKRFLTSQGFDDDGRILRVFTLSTVIMARVRSYGSILDMSLYTLEYANNSALLTAVIETLRQHIEVWACMDRMKDVASALWTVHQTWRSRGLQNRVLLKLLAEVDNEQHLDPAAREQMLSDISAFSHALFPSNENPDQVPQVLPEILLLATDPNPEAPSLLANSLWYKYMTSSDWAYKVWDNTVASLRQIPVMIEDVAGRRACALRYATFLLHVDQHLPRGLDEQIRSWFLAPLGRSEVAALTPETWDVVTVVLLYLICYGALTTTTMLESLIYNEWEEGAKVTSDEKAQARETLLTWSNTLFEHLLLRDECGTGLPPVDVFEAQGLQTRRRDVFREPYFSNLVVRFPDLVLIEQNRYLPEALRQATTNLRRTICRVSVFRQGIYRDLDSVRLAFEERLNPQNDELHEPLVSALRLMLNDPGQDGPVNAAEWSSASSLLSPWKLAATAIEIRLTIKQLGDGMSRESTRIAACASLDKLTGGVFYHCKSPEEADFVAEMITNVHKTVAGKFVNAGLKRIDDIIRETDGANKINSMTLLVSSAGEILRLIANIVAPFRLETSRPEKDQGDESRTEPNLPPIDAAVQEHLFTVLCAKFAEMTGMMAALVQEPWSEDISRGSQAVIFLARLLQFYLGFPAVWSDKSKELAEELCANLTRLALIHGSGEGLNMLAFPLIMDTLCYTLDSIPSDMKATAPFDPFRYYPEFNLSDLPSDMPLEYKARLRLMLPYVALNPTVEDLVYATRDAAGALVPTGPVQNRPWEWTEYIGDVAGAPADGGAVRNSAALALELFEARLTGDRVIPADARADGMMEENLHSMQDDVYAEGAFARDWRETRISLDDVPSSASAGRGRHEQDDGVPPLPALGGTPAAAADHRGLPRKPSPASSVRSVGSAHAFSRLSVSTAGEVIDVDALDGGTSGSGSTHKRKAMSSITEEDDDEVEFVEGPIPARPAKRTAKSKMAGKTTKGKKR
ncbi:Mediator of RNA polymerase II transcription subunit 12 [Trametes pubescens]|uniref:Mediator of RNA polymerase II transcription subunit 12 n=1 Tax=Trametes pubescens TaxID=154538 RepID=A0A1M2VNT2_TRAPU|nr:Mediator of RNA polymerase II transcription subunit 12 [Trametes pubescens]